jgi:hypothetical protein
MRWSNHCCRPLTFQGGDRGFEVLLLSHRR